MNRYKNIFTEMPDDSISYLGNRTQMIKENGEYVERLVDEFIGKAEDHSFSIYVTEENLKNEAVSVMGYGWSKMTEEKQQEIIDKVLSHIKT